MKLINIGKGAKVGTVGLKRSIVIVDDISKIDSLINIEENGEIINIDADGNEVHTNASYALKLKSSRDALFNELQIEISNLKNEVLQAKLLRELEEIKEIPLSSKGQLQFKIALDKFKNFASELGAKVIAEIAMKQLGF